VTPAHPIPCSMLDREPVMERAVFFQEKREVSNHFACLARASARRLAGFARSARGVARVLVAATPALFRVFVVIAVTARTKRRVIAVIARFSFGLPWS
jgi:hypothetical protein